MSSEAFETREDAFRGLYNSLNKKLNEQVPKLVGEERKKLIRNVHRGIEEATLLIEDMEQDAQVAPQPYRMQMSSRVRTYKSDIEKLSQQITQAAQPPSGRENYGFSRQDDFENMVSSQRPQLTRGLRSNNIDLLPLQNMASGQRAQLMRGSEMLSRTSDSIARSQRIAAETDDIGHNIINELGEQRESLVRTRGRLHETDAGLSQSRKILKSMARRVMTNKIILIFIIVLELAILAGLVYWKFFS